MSEPRKYGTVCQLAVRNSTRLSPSPAARGRAREAAGDRRAGRSPPRPAPRRSRPATGAGSANVSSSEASRRAVGERLELVADVGLRARVQEAGVGELVHARVGERDAEEQAQRQQRETGRQRGHDPLTSAGAREFPPMELGLEGSAVLVTGAAGGIGAATARALAAEGARVAVHYHSSREAAEALAAQIGGVRAAGRPARRGGRRRARPRRGRGARPARRLRRQRRHVGPGGRAGRADEPRALAVDARLAT